MTTQLGSRRRVAVFRSGISAVALLLILVVSEHAMATSVFAQPHGAACLTQMPIHDAFVRYVFDDYGAALAEVDGAGQGQLPNIDVGAHNYALDYVGGRRVTKLDFMRVTSARPFGDAYDYSRAADRSPQWRVAYASQEKPDVVGVFGETGALGFTGSTSFRCEYATATGSNPGYLWPRVAPNPILPAGFTASSWMIGSAPQIVEHEHEHGTVNFTYYQTSQALGEIGVKRLIPPTGTQTGGGPGFSYTIDSHTRFYTTVSLQNQRPALSILMQLK